MKISEIKLAKFKRFKDLTVSGLPETAKLVVLVGPNGCGKSSLFDAIYAHAQWLGRINTQRTNYYDRASDLSADATGSSKSVSISFHNTHPNTRDDWEKAVYVRSAYRNDPSFVVETLGKVGSALKEQRFHRMIDNDQVASKNYLRLVSQALEGAFESMDGSKTLDNFRDEILADIRNAVQLLFPGLVLNSLGNPLGGGATFRFDKGDVKNFAYENLSGGEKAAFDLILDLIIKRREYNDTVFCIDEPEAHIALGVQGDLLGVLYEFIPDGCQLWIATHSIGMMRKAYELYKAKPENVVFLDFTGRDFDKAEQIAPAQMDRDLWERMHSVVLEDLADLIFPGAFYICESDPKKNFDADCYNAIFSRKHSHVKFVSVGGKGAVTMLTTFLRKAMPGKEIFGVRDRDNMTDEEIVEERKKGVQVLSRTDIEEYLLEDDVLAKLCKKHNLSDEMFSAIKQMRNAGKNHPKKAANDIRTHLVNHHRGLQIGDNRESFLKNLAHLMTPDMESYQELERDIFGS